MLAAVVSVCAAGCEQRTDEFGVTTYRVDPNKAETAENVVEGVAAALDALAGIWPELAVGAAGVSATLATWRKLKGKLMQEQTTAELYHTVGLALTTGIDEFKEAYPAQWKNLLEQLTKARDKMVNPEDQRKIENVIRGLRGKPALAEPLKAA